MVGSPGLERTGDGDRQSQQIGEACSGEFRDGERGDRPRLVDHRDVPQQGGDVLVGVRPGERLDRCAAVADALFADPRDPTGDDRVAGADRLRPAASEQALDLGTFEPAGAAVWSWRRAEQAAADIGVERCDLDPESAGGFLAGQPLRSRSVGHILTISMLH